MSSTTGRMSPARHLRCGLVGGERDDVTFAPPFQLSTSRCGTVNPVIRPPPDHPALTIWPSLLWSARIGLIGRPVIVRSAAPTTIRNPPQCEEKAIQWRFSEPQSIQDGQLHLYHRVTIQGALYSRISVTDSNAEGSAERPALPQIFSRIKRV